MFPELMKNLGGRKYKDDGDVETTLTRLLITKYTDRYKKKKNKLIPLWDKRPICGGDYVEK